MNVQRKYAVPEKPRDAKLLIGGKWVDGDGTFEVIDKFSGKVVANVAKAGKAQVDAAVAAAKKSFEEHKLTPFQRYEYILKASDLVQKRKDEFIQAYVAESGFTVSDANNEVTRSSQTFINAAEEAKRITGEMIPVESVPGQEHRMGFTVRVPIGVVCAITPFNAPVGTTCHKILPALAAGNTLVLKPASATPITAQLLCECLIEAGFPAAHINLVHGGGGEVGQALFDNEDIAFYGFTGSTSVGKLLRRAIGVRRCSLELGSIASTIICEDADLDWAVPRCLGASFRKAGQVCTSVQRFYVHETVADAFTQRLSEAAGKMKVGDPYDPETLVGPMIHEKEAERAEQWIREAVDAGATLVRGGTREGRVLQPTILTHVTDEMRVMCEEIFAPVVSIVPFSDYQVAFDSVNNTPYGLAAGVFTRDINRGFEAVRKLHVGGVHINETSSARVDLMPYGGVKESGDGREGPRYAIREMTEERMVTFATY